MLIYIAISGGRNVMMTEADKILKYKDVTTETRCMFSVKTKVISVIIGALRTISDSFRGYLSN